ncbi:phage antirepressor KilAC domain-containing protein [Paraburkholderia sediminicola]|uniref:phage antirepressor KilAC domain-containing protein n=1 Tax=Paraburkholderia sediminicola TaxID=458836 RepID=UPI0038B8FF5A
MKNGLLSFDPPQVVSVPTMSSHQMAELTQTRHDSVKRTLETLVERGTIAQPQFVDVPEPGSNGRIYTTKVYHLNERDSYVVVARLSPEFTAALVDYWQATKKPAAVQLPDFSNPAIAARAWAEQYELAAARQAQIEQQKPAVEYAEALRGTDEWIPMSVMAKKLKQAGYETGLKRLFDTLKADHILISSSEPYQRYADLFYIDTFTREDSNGRKVATETLRVTQKGEEFLLKRYATKRPTQRAAALDAPKGLGGFTKALSKAA